MDRSQGADTRANAKRGNRTRRPTVHAAGRVSYAIRKLIEGTFGRLLLSFALVMGLVILVFGLVFAFIGAGTGFKDPFWFSFLSLLGPDALFTVDETATPTRTVAAILVAFGIVAFNGIIVAIVVSRLQREFEAIHEGRGRIFERGHVVLLGWTDSTPALLRGLDDWCVTEGRKLLVVTTADEASEDLVRSLPRFRKLAVTHRRGLPQGEGILETVAAGDASCIIIQYDKFSPAEIEDPADDAVRDASVATAYIAARAELGESLPPCVVSMRGPGRMRDLEPFLDPGTRMFDEDRFVGAYIATLCIEPLVYAALDEMLSFRGCELHFRDAREDVGLEFRELQARYDLALPVGILRRGLLSLVPDPCERIGTGDTVVFIAENDKACLRPDHGAPGQELPSSDALRLEFIPASSVRGRRELLVVGRNRLLPHILEEFHRAGIGVRAIPAPGMDTDDDDREMDYDWASVDDLAGFERILLLADDTGRDRAQTDAETVFRTLSLMRYRDSTGAGFAIAAEFLDPVTEGAMSLLPGTGFTWIVGTQVSSELLAMAAIHRGYLDAFDDLLSESGTRILTGTLHRNDATRRLTFGEAVFLLGRENRIVPIGIFEDGRFILNPNRSTPLEDGAEIAVIAPFDLA